MVFRLFIREVFRNQNHHLLTEKKIKKKKKSSNSTIDDADKKHTIQIGLRFRVVDLAEGPIAR